jgi:hypothetical protein
VTAADDHVPAEHGVHEPPPAMRTPVREREDTSPGAQNDDLLPQRRNVADKPPAHRQLLLRADVHPGSFVMDADGVATRESSEGQARHGLGRLYFVRKTV